MVRMRVVVCLVCCLCLATACSRPPGEEEEQGESTSAWDEIDSTALAFRNAWVKENPTLGERFRGTKMLRVVPEAGGFHAVFPPISGADKAADHLHIHFDSYGKLKKIETAPDNWPED
jgi:hypothetical protein